MARTRLLPWARRFFRTAKGLLLAILVILVGLASFGVNLRLVAPGLAGAIAVSALIDLLILRSRHGHWEFPSGAVLTALFVVMVLSPFEPWYVATVTSAIAILSKYILRTRAANIFNPAALALVISCLLYTSPSPRDS